MSRPYLFGPVSRAFADENLHEARAAGVCRTFGPDGDVLVNPEDSWETVAARFPPGWHPEFIALWLPYTRVPPGLWTAPMPLLGLAADWNLLWHGYRHLLPRCDAVLTDAAGVEVCAQVGIDHAFPANLFGCERAFLDGPPADAPRAIDLFFVGNLHPVVQRERLPWLGRLARLGQRWRVRIATGVFGADYRQLLARARIVFNRSIRGECNRRVFEAASHGCLLFQEAGNRELADYFAAGRECVTYTDATLEALLDHYLTHDDERRTLAEAARQRVRDFTFESLWRRALERLEAAWPGLEHKAMARRASERTDDWQAQTWEACSRGDSDDPSLARALTVALDWEPHSAELHNALGLAVTLAARGNGRITSPMAERAVEHFRRAVASDPAHVVAHLNWAEAFAGSGRAAEAVAQARRALATLERGADRSAVWLDAGHFPPSFDWFRVEWERADWANAGQPAAETRAKRDLIRWRLHTLLADLTGDLLHYYEAALARPDLPITQAGLGCALCRAGRFAEGLPHLRQAVADNPFDPEAARALFKALGDAGDGEGQRRYARERHLLAQAAPGVLPAEPWVQEAPPVGDELASVIILCCNQVDYTRMCLESVLEHTRPPYELIVIDNGSTDGTAAYLEALHTRPGPARVEVIHNASNVGFPAGCNQGLAYAQGRYLVFLNNDTVVTPGWLNQLIACALSDWPHIGMVGPVTNYSRPPQQIPIDYDGLENLAAFAARRRQDYAGKALHTERLTGFCLLARRDVLNRIGGFDERYGAGFFDDDDLCVRARQTGLQLAVALDVFIHHFGSRTFQGLGIDCHDQLLKNFEQFRAKWGNDEAAGYRLPAPATGPAAAPAVIPNLVQTMCVPAALTNDVSFEPIEAPHIVLSAGAHVARQRVTLCLIVKNEERNLPACLGSAADLADEIIVVDTGSTDGTRAIARQHGARVIDFPWCDSFAAARNEGLRHATGEWIFWLDADDRLDADNRRRLQRLFADLKDENVAYSMKCLCLAETDTDAGTAVDHIRLFRNHPAIRWQYRVHEQILPAIRRLGGTVRFTDVVIQHTGYVDPRLRRHKMERDLRLLRREDQEHPDDPFTLFNLASLHQELGRHAEALPLLRRSLERSHHRDSIVRKLYSLMVGSHKTLGQHAEARAICRQGREHFPDDTELLFIEAVLRREQGDRAGAAAALERLLATEAPAYFGSVDAGLRGYKGRHNLAVIYHELGRDAEAEAQWRAAVAERPEFIPGWLSLADLFLVQRRWDDLEQWLIGLQAYPQAQTEVAVMRARAHMARGEFATAQQMLRATIARQPRAVWPQVILSHALLQEGKDVAAAEQALRDVLALDPDHVEARRNLTVLLERQGKPADAFLAQGLGLAELYHRACTTPSDIHEHLPTLYELASTCRHITELGTRTGMSTTAFLFAQPDTLVCYDKLKYPQVDRLKVLAGRTQFHFVQADVLDVTIDPTDLLFIDTWHVYPQLQAELRLHAAKARKFIVLHDTTTFGERGESDGQRGLWPAVEEFLAEGTFRLRQRYTNNNGLAILERVGPAALG